MDDVDHCSLDPVRAFVGADLVELVVQGRGDDRTDRCVLLTLDEVLVWVSCNGDPGHHPVVQSELVGLIPEGRLNLFGLVRVVHLSRYQSVEYDVGLLDPVVDQTLPHLIESLALVVSHFSPRYSGHSSALIECRMTFLQLMHSSTW